MRELTIGTRTIAKERPPFVIAEIGINHEGSLDKADADGRRRRTPRAASASSSSRTSSKTR